MNKHFLAGERDVGEELPTENSVADGVLIVTAPLSNPRAVRCLVIESRGRQIRARVRPPLCTGRNRPAATLRLLERLPAALVAFWVASVVGGVIAIFLLATRRKGRKDLIPYGVFMSLGGLVALWAGDDIFSWYRGLVY